MGSKALDDVAMAVSGAVRLSSLSLPPVRFARPAQVTY
jgi:hypothetical protein